jgi:hypothetical protein
MEPLDKALGLDGLTVTGYQGLSALSDFRRRRTIPDYCIDSCDVKSASLFSSSCLPSLSSSVSLQEVFFSFSVSLP